jgi:uracil-DNA glycosylase
MIEVPPSGPRNAKVMLVGEAPGFHEEEQGRPFVGESGKLLRKMLRAAGLNFDDCFVTNVARVRPYGNDIERFFLGVKEAKAKGLDDQAFERRQGKRRTYAGPEVRDGLAKLHGEILEVCPELIVPLGSTALWALTRESSIDSWAGSMLQHPSGAHIVPTNHPARVMRQWELLNITIADLRRAKRQLDTPISEPEWAFLTAPTRTQVLQLLGFLLGCARQHRVTASRQLEDAPTRPLKVAIDIETTRGYILSCVGIAWSETEAICIPFLKGDGSPYFTQEDEIEIVLKLRELIAHPNVINVGQNYAFDAQYFARDFGVVPTRVDDTIVGHQVCYPGTPRDLAYLSRHYLPWHRYWKDDAGGKFADDSLDVESLWRYNCRDATVTYAAMTNIWQQIQHFNLTEQYKFQMSMWHRLLRRMIRGVRFDITKQGEFILATESELGVIENELHQISEGIILSGDKTMWWHSPQQTATVLYDLLRYPEMVNRKTHNRSTDDEALAKLRKRDPLLVPIIDRILALRSLGVFNSTFLGAKTGSDNRIRTTYDIAGTETFRLASRKDSFGGGCNQQNVPRLR